MSIESIFLIETFILSGVAGAMMLFVREVRNPR